MLYIDIEKAIAKANGKISRNEAKAVHPKGSLPEGGQWKTIMGHHVYIVGSKVVASSLPKESGKGAKKATKEHLQELQAHIDKKAGKQVEKVAGEARVSGMLRGGHASDNGDGTVTFHFNGNHNGKRGNHEVVIPKERFTAHSSEKKPAQASEEKPAKAEKKAESKAPSYTKNAQDMSGNFRGLPVMYGQEDGKHTLYHKDTGEVLGQGKDYSSASDQAQPKIRQLLHKQAQEQNQSHLDKQKEQAEKAPKLIHKKTGKLTSPEEYVKDAGNGYHIAKLHMGDKKSDRGAVYHMYEGKTGKVVGTGDSADSAELHGKKTIGSETKDKPITVSKQQVKKPNPVKSSKTKQKTPKEERAIADREREENRQKMQNALDAEARQKKTALAKRNKEEESMDIKKLAPKNKKKVDTPSIHQTAIPSNDSAQHKQRQQEANEDFSPTEAIKPKVQRPNQLTADQVNKLKNHLDTVWNSPAVQDILKQPANKRNLDQIKQIAGKITTAMNPLATHYAQKKASQVGAYGDPVRMQEKTGGGLGHHTKSKEAREDGTLDFSGFHGDLQQVARASMFETLHNILAGSQKPGTNVSTHTIKRMKDAMTNAYHNFLNQMPVKERLRPAIRDLNNAESQLSHQLGRKPTDQELAKHLEENSKHFRDEGYAENGSTKHVIPKRPEWDKEKNEYVAKKGRIEDPVERLNTLRMYRDQQKAGSTDANVGSEGEREVELGSSIKDMNESPEERTIRKEREHEVKSGLESVFNDLGIKDAEAKVLKTAFSGDSRGGKVNHKEIAEELNRAGHKTSSGGEFTHDNVRAIYSRAMKKLQNAYAQNHPKLAELKKLMTKSMWSTIQRTFFQIDLIKSLNTWGVGLDVLEERFVRVVTGQTMEDIYKSLAPYEGIGTLVTTEDGLLHARVVELALPDSNALYKSFNAHLNGLKKSLFPHKSNSNHAINQKASEYEKTKLVVLV